MKQILELLAGLKMTSYWFSIIIVPCFRPGWFMRCLFGPYDSQWLDYLIADILAGITVALTLIPQGTYQPIY